MTPSCAIADAKAAQARTGVSSLASALALAVAGPESSWRADAVGDNGTSFGYTQLHVGGGLGDGHSLDELLDGVSNFAIAMREIQRRLDMGMSNRDALGPWSTQDIALQGLDQAMAALGSAAPAGTSGNAGTVVLLALTAAVIIWLIN